MSTPKPVQGTPVRTLTVPYRVLVQRADPRWEQDKRNEIQYEFSNGRQFRADPTRTGAYADD